MSRTGSSSAPASPRMPLDGMKLARFAMVLLAGLFLGGIIHVATVIGIPGRVPQAAHARIAAFGPDGRFNLLPAVRPGAEPLPMLDPTMLHATCRFALEDGPLMIEAALPPPFWSFALFNARGEAIYSLNDRTSGNGGRLEALVLTSEQLAILRENPPVGLEDMIVIETTEREGYALLRAFDGDPLRHDILVQAMDQAKCRPIGEDGQVIGSQPAPAGAQTATPAG